MPPNEARDPFREERERLLKKLHDQREHWNQSLPNLEGPEQTRGPVATVENILIKTLKEVKDRNAAMIVTNTYMYYVRRNQTQAQLLTAYDKEVHSISKKYSNTRHELLLAQEKVDRLTKEKEEQASLLERNSTRVQVLEKEKQNLGVTRSSLKDFPSHALQDSREGRLDSEGPHGALHASEEKDQSLPKLIATCVADECARGYLYLLSWARVMLSPSMIDTENDPPINELITTALNELSGFAERRIEHMNLLVSFCNPLDSHLLLSPQARINVDARHPDQENLRLTIDAAIEKAEKEGPSEWPHVDYKALSGQELNRIRKGFEKWCEARGYHVPVYTDAHAEAFLKGYLKDFASNTTKLMKQVVYKIGADSDVAILVHSPTLAARLNSWMKGTFKSLSNPEGTLEAAAALACLTPGNSLHQKDRVEGELMEVAHEAVTKSSGDLTAVKDHIVNYLDTHHTLIRQEIKGEKEVPISEWLRRSTKCFDTILTEKEKKAAYTCVEDAVYMFMWELDAANNALDLVRLAQYCALVEGLSVERVMPSSVDLAAAVASRLLKEPSPYRTIVAFRNVIFDLLQEGLALSQAWNDKEFQRRIEVLDASVVKQVKDISFATKRGPSSPREGNNKRLMAVGNIAIEEASAENQQHPPSVVPTMQQQSARQFGASKETGTEKGVQKHAGTGKGSADKVRSQKESAPKESTPKESTPKGPGKVKEAEKVASLPSQAQIMSNYSGFLHAKENEEIDASNDPGNCLDFGSDESSEFL